ncbi:MAG: hypothetical protein K9W44_03740 [Candidatus Lokiarchaeota archaeon]|nr:hypothetical protein [Candidatus Harpocratesius repetitus]
MLWLSARLIISKSYAVDKKFILLIAAIILVILVPLVGSGAGFILGLLGDLFSSLRNLITPGQGRNYVVQLVPIVVFFVFMVILKFIAGMDWRDATWISFISLLLLYCLYSLVPELDFMGSLV